MNDEMKRGLKVQRAFLEAYVLGVESRMRGKLTTKERNEIRYAWMAGFIYGQSQAGVKS
jgi:hypothetical protein